MISVMQQLKATHGLIVMYFHLLVRANELNLCNSVVKYEYKPVPFDSFN